MSVRTMIRGNTLKKEAKSGLESGSVHSGDLGEALGFPAKRACSPPLHLIPLLFGVPLTVFAYSLTNT